VKLEAHIGDVNTALTTVRILTNDNSKDYAGALLNIIEELVKNKQLARAEALLEEAICHVPPFNGTDGDINTHAIDLIFKYVGFFCSNAVISERTSRMLTACNSESHSKIDYLAQLAMGMLDTKNYSGAESIIQQFFASVSHPIVGHPSVLTEALLSVGCFDEAIHCVSLLIDSKEKSSRYLLIAKSLLTNGKSDVAMSTIRKISHCEFIIEKPKINPISLETAWIGKTFSMSIADFEEVFDALLELNDFDKAIELTQLLCQNHTLTLKRSTNIKWVVLTCANSFMLSQNLKV
jgi:tetratricopeptide (TPR) repeat protein